VAEFHQPLFLDVIALNFSFPKKNLQMKAGKNKKYDITKT
jgi:hypothetical protein